MLSMRCLRRLEVNVRTRQMVQMDTSTSTSMTCCLNKPIEDVVEDRHNSNKFFQAKHT